MRTRRSITQRITGVLRLLAILGLTGGLASCSNIEPVAPQEPITDPAQMYMQLTLDHSAINLSAVAPYNTLQLTAAPYDGRGEVMTDLPAPTFRLAFESDTAFLRVTPDGLVTALQPAAGVKVIAEVVLPGPIRHQDTAWVNVTDLAPPPTLASLSVHPLPPDSAIQAIGGRSGALGLFLVFGTNDVWRFAGGRTLSPRAWDAAGTPVTGLQIEYASLDPAIATVDRRNGSVRVWRPGQARMVARTTAYGISKADTITFTVTWPVYQALELGSSTPATDAPSEVRIAPHGLVAWGYEPQSFDSLLSDSIDVTFEGPANVIAPPDWICSRMATWFQAQAQDSGRYCGTGDVLISGATWFGNWRLRQFPVPGVYTYHTYRHSTRISTTGRIVVTEDLTTSAVP